MTPLSPVIVYAGKMTGAVTAGASTVIGGLIAATGTTEVVTVGAGATIVVGALAKILLDQTAIVSERQQNRQRVETLEARVVAAEAEAELERERRHELELLMARHGVYPPKIGEPPAL